MDSGDDRSSTAGVGLDWTLIPGPASALIDTLKIGAHVKKGVKGTTVVFADRFIPWRERTRAGETGDEPEAIPFLKRFTVFNADQCEGLPEDLAPAPAPAAENLILPQAEALIRATGADIRIGGNRAFFMCRARILSRCRCRRATSSRSTGIARCCMNWFITAAIRPG